MLVVHNSLTSRQLNTPLNLEIVSVEVTVTCNSPVLVYVMSISPASNFTYNSEVFLYLESIASHSHVVIIGDFNLPDISWPSLTGQSPPSIAFCDLVFWYNLTQFVDFPTHSMGNKMDLVQSSSNKMVCNLYRVSSQFLSSDHSTFSFKVLIVNTKHIKKACKRSFFDFNKTDFDGLSSFLRDMNFGPLFQLYDVEFVWSFLKKAMLYSISLFTPQIRVRTHPYPVWFHSDVRHELNKTRSARKKCKRNPFTHNLLHLSSTEH